MPWTKISNRNIVHINILCLFVHRQKNIHVDKQKDIQNTRKHIFWQTIQKDSQPRISYRLVSHCKPLGPIISTFKFGNPCWSWRRGPRSNLTTSENSQLMISYRLVSHCKPPGPIISELLALLSLSILVWPWRRGPRSNLTTS